MPFQNRWNYAHTEANIKKIKNFMSSFCYNFQYIPVRTIKTAYEIHNFI